VGSKIKIPDPYPWREICGHGGIRGYILVLHQDDLEVVRLAESDVMTGANSDELCRRLEDKYLNYADHYPYPEYDIIQARVRDLRELSVMFGATDGFAGVEVERVTS
jgi:hypothetical protein